MRKVLLCACGVAVTGFGEDDLLDRVEGHLMTRHAGKGIKAMERHLVTCGCGHELWSHDAAAICDGLLDEVVQRAAGPIPDDATVVVAKFTE